MPREARKITGTDTEGMRGGFPWAVPFKDWPTVMLRKALTEGDEFDGFPTLAASARAILVKRPA